MDGDHVLVTWKPSPARAGRVQYRVMRGQDRAPVSPSEGTAVVTRTEQTDVTDAEAPPGAYLFYSVFAARGGDTWSPPASAPPAMFTPEVTDVSVTAADTSVAASWRPHPAPTASSWCAARTTRRGDGTTGRPSRRRSPGSPIRGCARGPSTTTGS